MDEMLETERVDLLGNFVSIDDMFNIEDSQKDFIVDVYGEDSLAKLDAQTVAAGDVVDSAREDGMLSRVFTVKMMIDKMPDFGKDNEQEKAYLDFFENTLYTFKQGFTYNIAKGVDSYFYNDEMKKMLF